MWRRLAPEGNIINGNQPATDSIIPQHPDGPRTFVTFLRDNTTMPQETLARMLALETGRHVTLTEARAALGLDLNLEATGRAAQAAAVPRGVDPTDADLAGVIDAMWRAVESTRLVRVEIGDGGPSASRAREAIRLREGEQLVLLVLADNRTDAAVEFSAESHGEGFGGVVEPGRVATALLDVGALPAGSYLLPLLVVAGGRPVTVDLPIECAAAGVLVVRIIDDETGDRVAARVYLADDNGPAWPLGATLRRDVHGDAFFHAESFFEARISGRARLRIVRGIEYEPHEAEVAVPADGEASAEARLRRWSHMAADGWYSGDVHVHLHYGGEYLLSPEDAALAQRGEDVHFMNMMVANQGSFFVHDEGHFEGKPHAASSTGHILQWGEEYRNDFYGHMCMYGIDALVPPIHCGWRYSDHPHDLPANATAAQRCHDAGGTLSYAHPLFASGDLDRVFAVARTVEAKELPVDAALGLIDAVDVLSYPSRNRETAELWYRLLNCGLRLAATAGSDTFMNVCDQGEFSNPPAGVRVFARVEGDLTTDAWCAAVRAGRTFVTNGPMIALDIDGRGPGDEIASEAGAMLRIEAQAGSFAPLERLELIVDGAVVASAEAEDGGRAASLTHDLRIERSCWVAARATGGQHPQVLDPDGVYAHTSAVFVTVAGAPLAHADDAAYFVDWIERLIAITEQKGRYPTDADRDAVIALFREGQAFYRGLTGGGGG